MFEEIEFRPGALLRGRFYRNAYRKALAGNGHGPLPRSQWWQINMLRPSIWTQRIALRPSGFGASGGEPRQRSTLGYGRGSRRGELPQRPPTNQTLHFGAIAIVARKFSLWAP